MNAPYMNLTLPDPTVTSGPTWSVELNAAITTIDSHDHSPGKGTLVPSSGLTINTDLTFQGNAATELQRSAYDSQTATLSSSNITSVYVANGNLWYNNDSGVPIQITAGTSITSASSPLVPSGVIWPYGGTSAPTGFLLCDGTLVSRATYATLFAVIGTQYGIGDGSTTFGLPNANGSVPMGAGTYTDAVSGPVTRAMGEVLGAEKHVLTVGELASHTHNISDPGHTHQYSYDVGGAGTPGPIIAGVLPGTADGTTSHTVYSSSGMLSNTTGITVTQNQGSSTAHNNVQPSFVTNFIIKT